MAMRRIYTDDSEDDIGIHYKDEGCDLAPSCLNCPFPACRYDMPKGIRHATIGRNTAIITRVMGGEPVWDVAQSVGLGQRRVRAIVQNSRR